MLIDQNSPAESSTASSIEHERLVSLIGSMADGVLAVDDDIKIVQYNGAVLSILDVNSTLEGQKLKKVLTIFDANSQEVDVNALVRGCTTPSAFRDYLLHYADGSKANLYLSIAPVRLGYGTAGKSGYVLLLRDITREKSLEEERDEFISVVSHELRTPIAIAEGNIGNAQFMVEKGMPIEQINVGLKVAHDQILFLAEMINDLSTLSRAERGKLTFEIETINPHTLIEDLIKTYKDEAEKKGLKLLSDISPQLETLQSGPLYVREVLQNFITNAIKYTEKGSVTIGAQPADKGVRFTVADTGIGISKSDRERVFDKFFRSEDFRTRAHSGTGLGLYVTMKLSRLLRADITLDSELNKGSTFTIFIPNLK
jgi:two-component system phosphate regulon sensor histidine kinase PhoR